MNARVLVTLMPVALCSVFFFFNDTATTEIYTLSLHDALPIFACPADPLLAEACRTNRKWMGPTFWVALGFLDRKSTRLNSSHLVISYAVFCLKKKTIDALAIDVSRLAVSRASDTSSVPQCLLP